MYIYMYIYMYIQTEKEERERAREPIRITTPQTPGSPSRTPARAWGDAPDESRLA